MNSFSVAKLFTAAIIMVFAPSSSVLGQIVLDDSFPEDAGVTFEQLHQAVSADFLAPRSAQYKRFQMNDRIICGVVNTRNAQGGYDEFGPFFYGRAEGNALVITPDQLTGYIATLTALFKDAGCPLSSLGLAEFEPTD